ncbi:MAG: hypothetical protein HQ518_29675 [Rhodopirellula sp.]|nr:hypothetical protein [Rhodopirellula sp.]
MHLKSVAFILLLVSSQPVFVEQVRADDDAKVQVTFYAMGDVPYAPEEDVLLPKQIADLPNDAEFVIHVGDIKRGVPLCNEAVYNKVAGMLSKSAAPVFIIPGDNEWNDCLNPAQAWTYWDQYFMKFDRHWKHDLTVERQKIREENFAFVKGNVLFVGLNIVGGRVHDEQEWKLRHASNLDWVKSSLQRSGKEISSLVVFGHAKPAKVHDDFFGPFSQVAEDFEKPVLYLHGDGHKWIYDRPFKATNILRVQVDQGGIAPPLKVSVTDDPTKPFRFDRRNGKKAS